VLQPLFVVTVEAPPHMLPPPLPPLLGLRARMLSSASGAAAAPMPMPPLLRGMRLPSSRPPAAPPPAHALRRARAPAPGAPPPRCGGCGAPLAHRELSLARASSPSGAGDTNRHAAAAALATPRLAFFHLRCAALAPWARDVAPLPALLAERAAAEALKSSAAAKRRAEVSAEELRALHAALGGGGRSGGGGGGEGDAKRRRRGGAD
jgi:hypothetical protein